MLWLLSLLLAGPAPDRRAPDLRTPAPVIEHALARTPAAQLPQDLLLSRWRRVRSAEPRIRDLLIDGVRRSRTFAELIVQVQRSDVIVYIEFHKLPLETTGRLLLQAMAGRVRYLRVQIRAGMPWDETIAVIAHELRHALEVAAEPDVVDVPALEGLYRRIGFETQVHLGFDTDAVRETGRRVRAELRG